MKKTRIKPQSIFLRAGIFTFGIAVFASFCACSDDSKASGNNDNSGTDSNSNSDTGSVPIDLDTEPVIWTNDVDTEAQQLAENKFRGVQVVDKDYLLVHFVDGEVVFHEDAQGPCAYDACIEPDDNSVTTYGEPLDLSVALSPVKWHITSANDPNYGSTGQAPLAIYQKSKPNGMAQMEWGFDDFEYEYTMEHFLYLELPSSLVPGTAYTIQMAPETNTDIDHWTFTYDIFNSRSEALHVNLSGYHPNSEVHAADLYIWLGNGGARDYSAFEGNTVYLYNVDTQESQEVGQVRFWKESSGEAQGYNFTQSNVWNVDFTGAYTPGVYRIAVEGVGASQDFVIGEQALFEPFRVSTLGYFYMRIGQDSMDMTPIPRRPLWLPGESPADCRVVVTDMDPWHPAWPGGGDRWDEPDFFAQYVKAGSPENPNAKGGHSDALDWDRHLGHIANIYDMLLSYILTNGNERVAGDNLGIAESGNGIPDIIDEARNEVDFWLALRYEGGYSHGLSNPNKSTNVLYQADNTAMAAWASAVNAAMLAAAFQIAGNTELTNEYLSAAEEAWNYANGLSDQMLDETQNLGVQSISGRDLRMTAAAWLYNVTGNTSYEDIVQQENIVTGEDSVFITDDRNQYYAMAAYLTSSQEINYPGIQANMRSAVIYQARNREASYSDDRPSRRATDDNRGFFHTAQWVHRTILAHAVATNDADRQYFERALVLESDWGLGRNPANMIQMTTASTNLENKRSVENCYTSGANDGTPGMHPGHTPYMNIDDWGGMVMARPSWMTEKCYPDVSNWPRAELFFNTRYIWAHSEFTPQQSMRGKLLLYGYLLGMDR